ncbi:hypothetical protein COCVIDRAFT_13777 [Bipolaris victoriae FI3]|uniref:Uncharacterized protein n=1 Tax=Bipolaris victoriae (strain FI3) TaxID=930091 RepID=W7ER88_BIPV3|nr:hypothetical protein COCVIDRAFT_13777 [Bipolaris victoriae FI3]
MPSTPQPLFPDLPPELRNEIYTYLSSPSPDSQTLNSHLPLPLKTFTCKHTTMHLCPTHHGSTSLLSLSSPEAHEYGSWLLNNGIALHITIHFKGRVNTFTLPHWSKKISTHLQKLARRHPWLAKVARYEIDVMWDPLDGALQSRHQKQRAAHVPLDMAEALTQLMQRDVGAKQGSVVLRVHFEQRFAVLNALAARKFGVGVFLRDGERLRGFRRVVREVRIVPSKVGLERDMGDAPAPGLRVVPSAGQEEEALMVVEEGVMKLSERTRGQMVVRRRTSGVADGVWEYGRGEMEFPVCQILEECME